MSSADRFIPVARPWMDEREVEAARRPILSGWVTQGPEVAAFEREFAAYVGALGAFITGSNTVSNLLFADFQYGIAVSLNISREIIVALQAVGGAMGDMICVHKVVAACATVGLIGLEGLIIRRTMLPMVLYGIVVGITGLLLTFLLFPGVF